MNLPGWLKGLLPNSLRTTRVDRDAVHQTQGVRGLLSAVHDGLLHCGLQT